MNEVKKHSMGMLVIGGFVWLLYLGYVNLLTLKFGVPHLTSEITGIPLSWVVNYGLNTVFNFRQPIGWKRFASFCAISGVGWLAFLLTTYVCTDVLRWHVSIGPLVGVGTKTAMNIIMQQAITFGYLGEQRKKQAQGAMSKRANYDWNAYFHGNPLQKWWKHRIASIAVEMVGGRNPVCDIGVGSSPVLSLLPGEQKVGVDIDAGKVAFMQEMDETSLYICGKGEDTGLEEGHYTAVLCLEVLEHHAHPYELVKELARIAKVGGKVVIATPDFSKLLWNVIEVLYGLLMRKGYHLEHGMKFTESAVVALCEGVGLEWVRTESVLGADLVMEFRKAS